MSPYVLSCLKLLQYHRAWMDNMEVAESRRHTIHVTNLESEAIAWHSGFWKFAVTQSQTSLYLQAQLSLNGGISKKAN